MLPALVVVAGVAAYVTSLDAPFIFDDDRSIVRNEHVHHLWPIGDVLAHARRPVVSLSLAVNYVLGGLGVWGYRALNLSIHILAGLTLFGVVRRTMLIAARQPGHGALPPSGPFATERARPHHRRIDASVKSAWWTALVVSLIWVVHPLQTESVTYVIQRAESMMGLFYLLTLYCVIRGADSPRSLLWYAAAVLACALGMGSKAIMATAPVVVLLYDRLFLSKTLLQAVRSRWHLYTGLAATWSVLIATGVVGGVFFPSAASGRPAVGFGYTGVTPLTYALSQPGVILHYLRLSLWPHPLCLDYGWPVARGAGTIVVPGLVIAALVVSTLWLLRWRPTLGFAAAAFFLILAPTSSFIPIKDLAFEHRMYLPLASVVVVCIAVGRVALGYLCNRLPLGPRVRMGVAVALVVLVAGGLSYGTLRRNQDYRDEERMWRGVIAQRPDNARAYYNWGRTLAAVDRLDEAVEAYRESVRLDPFYASAYYNLGNVLAQLEQYDQAAEALQETLRLDPRHVKAQVHLASILLDTGKVDESVARYRAALQLDPRHAMARAGLAKALRVAGRKGEALEAYRVALDIDPNRAETHSDLGALLIELGRFDEAVDACLRAVQTDPDYALGHYNLANALLNLGRTDEAVESYRRALEIDPADVSAHVNLGNALVRAGRLDEAIESLREAVRIDPRHANAHYSLGRALFKKGRYGAAADAFSEVLTIDPDDAGAAQALSAARAAQANAPSR